MRGCRSTASLVVVLPLAALLAGCMASRTPIEGAFARPAERNPGPERVSVLFVFRHLAQMHGFDAIPKLQSSGVKDFELLFADALRELGNVSRFETFTELPNDVYEPERREELASGRAAMDYTVEIEFLEESSFAAQCFWGTISLLSLTAIPTPYDWDYTISAEVTAKDGRRVATLERRATLTNWVEAFLIFVYPFYPLEGKREEIYAESLHDMFRQLETERILK